MDPDHTLPSMCGVRFLVIIVLVTVTIMVVVVVVVVVLEAVVHLIGYPVKPGENFPQISPVVKNNMFIKGVSLNLYCEFFAYSLKGVLSLSILSLLPLSI